MQFRVFSPDTDDLGFPETCNLCENESSERVYFRYETGERFWICQRCVSNFKNKSELDEFFADWLRRRLYAGACRLQRFCILAAPKVILLDSVRLLARIALRMDKLFVRDLKKLVAEGERLEKEDACSVLEK